MRGAVLPLGEVDHDGGNQLEVARGISTHPQRTIGLGRRRSSCNFSQVLLASQARSVSWGRWVTSPRPLPQTKLPSLSDPSTPLARLGRPSRRWAFAPAARAECLRRVGHCAGQLACARACVSDAGAFRLTARGAGPRLALVGRRHRWRARLAGPCSKTPLAPFLTKRGACSVLPRSALQLASTCGF